ncbi:MAG TPA: hypothetical protein PKD31_22590, partial [Blastocatellia bacterium]|nr:hypothetical protein [Blastocatellia bacterium]
GFPVLSGGLYLQKKTKKILSNPRRLRWLNVKIISSKSPQAVFTQQFSSGNTLKLQARPERKRLGESVPQQVEISSGNESLLVGKLAWEAAIGNSAPD